MEDEALCPRCETRNRKLYQGVYSRFCIPCTFDVEKEQARLKAREQRKENKFSVCIHCGEKFEKYSSTQKQCRTETCLRQQKKKTEEEKWLNKKEDTTRRDSDRVAYSFFRKKYGVSKIFKVCRG